MSKEKKPDTRTDTQKFEDWRAKRKPLTRPNGKLIGRQKSQPKDDK